jgi:hypothetical protein
MSRATPSEAVALTRLDELHQRHAFELCPLLAALDLLADSQRVLHAISRAQEDAAMLGNPAGDAAAAWLRDNVAGWRSPMRDDPAMAGLAVVGNLARVAHDLAKTIGDELDAALADATCQGLSLRAVATRKGGAA